MKLKGVLDLLPALLFQWPIKKKKKQKRSSAVQLRNSRTEKRSEGTTEDLLNSCLSIVLLLILQATTRSETISLWCHTCAMRLLFFCFSAVRRKMFSFCNRHNTHCVFNAARSQMAIRNMFDSSIIPMAD